MSQTSRPASNAPWFVRRCANGCGRKATVVTDGHDFCASCYGQRRERIARKARSGRE